MGKRVLLFLGTNLLVIMMVSIIMNIFGLHSYLTPYGIDMQQLAIFCLIWGMTGSFVSLWMSKFMAKMAMGVVIINPKSATQDERFLIDIVHSLARKAKLQTMPEVGIYSSPELNAFATGPTRNDSLVAVSSGLLNSMNREQIEGVLGHEISHIANGDMVTMTLVQGVINAFALFLSRVVAYGISIALSRGDERSGDISYLTYGIMTIILDILFTLLGSILVAAYSRWREYRADIGGAKLAGKEKMIAALQGLKGHTDVEDERAPSLSALKISHHSSWLSLFSTHPPLDQRIKRLEKMRS